ncbi:MAG: hypothetical protein Ct9H300mP8_01670 [Gammaproteobacteria bacterium]|nr:MAG: hypothetical protein Ct9H300mP8_01670 [Gammaproteobacteria bacterium]
MKVRKVVPSVLGLPYGTVSPKNASELFLEEINGVKPSRQIAVIEFLMKFVTLALPRGSRYSATPMNYEGRGPISSSGIKPDTAMGKPGLPSRAKSCLANRSS